MRVVKLLTNVLCAAQHKRIRNLKQAFILSFRLTKRATNDIVVDSIVKQILDLRVLKDKNHDFSSTPFASSHLDLPHTNPFSSFEHPSQLKNP
jgi:hypothetical protein